MGDIAQQLLFRLEQLLQALSHGVEVGSEETEIVLPATQCGQYAHLEIPARHAARGEPQALDWCGEVAREEVTNHCTRSEGDCEYGERDPRQLELAEQSRAVAYWAHDHVVAAAIGCHEHQGPT